MRPAARRRAVLAFGLLAAALTVVALLGRPSGAGAQAAGELTVQPSLGAPAVTFLGPSSNGAPGEVWATAVGGGTLARYTDGGGWETIQPPVAAGGGPIGGLEFAQGAGAGRTTPSGGVVVAANASGEPIVVIRDPGGAFREAPDPSPLLEPGEALFPTEESGALLAAIDESGGRTGAYVVPERRSAVLHFDGSAWTKEEVCVGTGPGPECMAPPPAFRVLAMDAGEGEAWLLARNAAPGEGVELLRREAAGGPEGDAVWRQQSLGPEGSVGALYAQASPLDAHVAARGAGQPLTVTAAGVWADAVLTRGGEAIEATIYYDRGAGEVTGAWCDLPQPSPLCGFPLGAELPAGEGRSFAWPGGGPFGRRTVTGVGQGAILDLEGTAFARVPLGGGDAGAGRGAALSAPDRGWLGAKPPLQLTHDPEAAGLASWPVPFRRPLTAIAAEPGPPVGSLGSEALAVGDHGQVARYLPGQGWEPEPLLRSSGKRATPTLRAVAWPEPGRAYAVGDEAEMWLWQKATGLWEPDPAEPRNLARANFTGIAFDPADPSRGYAVGKQGLVLAYGREWTREPLPPGVPPEANFTSIAFAGREALATFKYPVDKGGAAAYTGGVLVDDGSGWRVDQGAEAALGEAVPQRVSGLSDGGAAIASLPAGEAGVPASAVIERQGAGAAWQPAAGGSIGYPVALAAIREAGQVRAIVSVAPQAGGAQSALDLATDSEQVFNLPAAGQAPLLTDPYPPPGAGLVARQTATGWRDEQHQAYPLPAQVEGQGAYDLPVRPDPVLALLVSPDGSQGWAVGGETGTYVRFQGEALQTAGVMRYGAGATAPPNASTAPLAAEPGMVSFAVGGDARCSGPCADLAGSGIGPDRWLKAAVAKAVGIGGIHAFLYTGPGVAGGGEGGLGATLGQLAFKREEAAYARRLGATAGPLPVFAAPAESDLDGAASLASFQAAFSGLGAPLGSAPPGAGIGPVSQAGAGHGYYSFDSAGTGGTVRVIVLDYSLSALGESESCWLAGELAGARSAGVPAIVVGERDLARQAPNAASDAGQVVPILLGSQVPSGCPVGTAASASAYFFDYPEQNRAYSLSAGGRSIPAFGSGSLGYVTPPRLTEADFVGASGFLIASVDVSQRDPATNVAPVTARLIPNAGSLALDPTDGTILRRSHQALFEGLARRPLAGTGCVGIGAPQVCESMSPEPYVPIPTQCQGARCATGIFPEYTFTSSEPEVADFVAHDPTSLNPRNVLLVNEKPVLDPHSGLLCTFNPGATTVTVSTGGLSYSQKVTVLDGTVQRPCGTTPLRRTAATEPGVGVPPPTAAAPGVRPSPSSLPPPPPPPPVPAPVATPASTPVHHSPPSPQTPPLFLPVPAQLAVPVVPIVPPPPAPVVEPTPPSGTATVTEREEEEEKAVDLVHHMVAHGSAEAGVALRHGGAGGVPPYAPPALAFLAALAAAGLRRPRRRRERPRPAYAASSRRSGARR